MKKVLSKFLVALLIVTMCVTLTPLQSFAVDDVEGSNVQAPGTEAPALLDATDQTLKLQSNEGDTPKDPLADSSAGNYKFTVNGIGDGDARTSTTFDVNDGVTFEVEDENGEVSAETKANFRVVAISVQQLNKGVVDSSFSIDLTQTTSFTTADDSNYSYKIVYQVQQKDADSNDWSPVLDDDGKAMNFTRTIDLVMATETKDKLTTDDEFISVAKVSDTASGTEPFDEDNEAGNDKDAANNIIRTFDTAEYTIDITSKAYSSGVSYKAGYVWFKFVLPYDKKEATFNTGAMGWISTDTGYKSYTTTEKLQVEDENGNTVEKDCQVLYAARYVQPKEGQNNALPISSMTVNLSVNVYGMKNGAVVQPIGYVWMDHNMDSTMGSNNPSNWTDAQRTSVGVDAVCSEHANNYKTNGVEVKQIANIKELIVSAAPSYDVMLLRNPNPNEKTAVYDFATGSSDLPNYDKGQVYGQADTYGFTLSLVGKNTDKGVRGVEIPTGEITFQVKTKTLYYVDGETEPIDISSTYGPLMYYGGKADSSYYSKTNDIGNGRPQIDGYTSGATVYNKWLGVNSNKNQSANNGGDWTITQNGSTFNVTVDNYEIDGAQFPTWLINRQNYLAGTRSNMKAFAGGWVQLVHQFGDKNTNDYLIKKYGAGHIQFTIEDVSMTATSLSGIKVNDTAGTRDHQAITNNDKESNAIKLTQPGVYSNILLYTKAGSYWGDFNGKSGSTANNNNSRTNCRDVAQLGQAGYITWGGGYDPKGYAENMIGHIESLVKFDPRYLDINGTPTKGSGYEVQEQYITRNYLYLGKTSVWDSYDEMNTTTIDSVLTDDSMKYYSSLAELEADGMVCVGVLLEGTAEGHPLNTTHKEILGALPIKVKTDSDVAGNAAITTVDSKAWTVGAMNDLAAATATSGFSLFATSTMATLIPSMLDVQAGTAQMPTPTTTYHTNYPEPKFDPETGRLLSGGPGNMSYGDALFITPYKVHIKKTIQQYASETGTTVKSDFNLDNEQSIVDFKIAAGTETLVEGSEMKPTTTVTVVDILPDGCSYVDGSTTIGGEYVQSSPVGQQGSVSGGESGIEYEPVKTKVKGTMVVSGDAYRFTPDETNGTEYNALIWTFEENEVGTTNNIYYSLKIDNLSAKNNQQYKNGSYIYTDEVKPASAYYSYDKNLSYAGFKVIKLASMSMVKEADSLYSDAGDDVGFTLAWQNTGENAKSGVFVDTMPANGVEGSSFDGNYSVKEITIQAPEGKSSSDYTVWYTNDASKVNDEITANDVTASWTQMELSADGVATVPANTSADNTKIAAWCVLGSIASGKMLKAHTTIAIDKNNNPGNNFTNVISFGSGSAKASSYVIERKLSGLTWIDANKDGERSANEVVLPGVKATLYMVNEDGSVSSTPYKNLSGETCVAITGEDGKYQFEHLEAGNYLVRFESGDTTLEGEYFLTTQKAEGVNENRNSKAELTKEGVNGTVSQAEITDIDMPAAKDAKKNPYILRYQDAGFYPSVDVTVNKTWDDDSDRDGKRPDSIQVQLKANGEDVEGKTATVEADADGNWTYTFYDLDKFDTNGKKIEYTVEESDVDGYTAETSKDGDYTVNIENSHDPELRDYTVQKYWADFADGKHKRPDSIQVQLTSRTDSEADFQPVEGRTATVKPDENGDWEYTFKDLYVYEKGKEIEYSIAEVKVPEGYVPDYISLPDGSGMAIINAALLPVPQKGEVDLAGVKEWDDNDDAAGARPDKIRVYLVKDGKVTDQYCDTTATDCWQYSFTGLPEVTDDGVEIEYSIYEEPIDDYTPTYEYNKTEGEWKIINEYTPGKTYVTVYKSWEDSNNQDGLRQDVQVQLMKNGEPEGQPVTLSDENHWSYTWTDLDIYKEEPVPMAINDDSRNVYTVEEADVPGYTAEAYVLNGSSGSTTVFLTNTHTPGTVEVSGSKTWEDDNDSAGLRPSSITINLYADGEKIASKKVKAKDDWSWTFSDLPEYREGEVGQLIEYTITEDEVKDYTSEVDGYDVTNTVIPPDPTPTPDPTPEPDPKTGDETPIGALAGLALAALAGMVAVLRRKRTN